MAQTIRDVMTPDPVTVPETASVVEAARLMRDRDVGSIVVTTVDGRARGLVTDRDVTVRVVAEGRDPATTTVGDTASRELTSVSPDTPVEEAVRQLRGKAIRRLPVMEGDRVVGIVSIGDIAMARDPRSALAEISTAQPNR